MSADFFASYFSGALGILIGNRLDVIKVQYQATGSSGLQQQQAAISPGPSTTAQANNLARLSHYFRGAAAPVIGYGALNSILFMSFNRSLKLMDPSVFDYTKLAGVELSKIWAAGAVGGLATWIVSAPSEFIKCRAQLIVDGQGSSYGVFRDTLRRFGVKGLYTGGVITAVRDSFGYGWYFWSYEICKRMLLSRQHDPFAEMRAWETLVAGGIAGVVTWVSIYPLDVVKTRVQTRAAAGAEETEALLGGRSDGARRKGVGAMEVAREIWRESGLRGLYRGVGVCSLRAFLVNAVQWYAYERIMVLMGPARVKVAL